MVDFTVAIPTYNGESRLTKVIEQLREQINTAHFSWEIIVVDNNSNDNTKEVVQDYQANWHHQPYPLRYCFEAQQGLSFARQRAVEEAKGTFVGFLDDDTLPASDWVAAAYLFGQEHPKAGAYGGQIHGNFEVSPPKNFERIQSFLAIKERGAKPNLYEPETLSLPPGAGLVIRKQAWLENVPTRLIRQGRGGNDFEISLHLHRGGWEIWYNPTMHIYHLIPKSRLEKDYLLSLIRTTGFSICQLRMINTNNWQKPIVIARIMLGNLRRATLHLIKYRWQVKNDLVAACEMAFFLSSLLSPFYFLKARFERERRR
ncbi:glycosyltransferase family 2 protein [Trichocoleus sp. FACHB-90]|uniref:hormogonium polysaccharide biosynthesis glycosyltransferase HpsE n=1 Tax=Cyanophyceae TaxID=3028117 RepID=UPI001683DD67|nr:hormogonium polysaccharide biosynthesis glycosyltransferase HpsE [Trichocoleus sp. FACHB-90]MBD1927468.1 glycosyltransferase family 2 protein [Trichocoleus sp. FACHB-90]